MGITTVLIDKSQIALIRVAVDEDDGPDRIVPCHGTPLGVLCRLPQQEVGVDVLIGEAPVAVILRQVGHRGPSLQKLVSYMVKHTRYLRCSTHVGVSEHIQRVVTGDMNSINE